MSKTVQISSPSHFSQITSSSALVVVDFYADWCGPCKTIAPIYEQLSSQLSRPNKITFTRVNVDEQQQIARSFNIHAMPTFLILKSSREHKRVTGASPQALQDAVQQLAREADSVDTSAGSSNDGATGSGETWLGAQIPRGYSDITDQVDVRGLEILNVDNAHGTARTLFDAKAPSGFRDGKDKKDWVESDTDEQLMLFIPFNSTIKIHSLQITSGAKVDAEEVMRPKTIKLFQNTNNNIGFDEAESMAATQELELKSNDWNDETKTAKAELRFVKFQRCSSLVLFVVDGDGSGDKCRIDRVRVIGEAGEKKTMGKLEKVGEES